MITWSGDRMMVSGDVTMSTASALFAEGLKSLENNAVVVDLSQLGKVDSSAASLMLVWLRAAKLKQINLRFEKVPANLLSLASLYGVAELMPLNTAE